MPYMPIESSCGCHAEITTRLSNLPPVNAVAQRVLALASKPGADMGQLGAVIELDPAFATDILVVANSPLFGLPARIRVLQHAIAILGMERIRSIAVTVTMRQLVRENGAQIRLCVEHSTACGVIAQLAAPAFDITGETAYTFGLLHDIGRLGLLKAYPAEYARLLASEFDSTDQVLTAERAILQMDHGQAGGWLTQKWGLPRTFADVCENHHEDARGDEPELHRLIQFACRLADALGHSAVRLAEAVEYEDVLRSVPAGVRELIPRREDVQAAVQERLLSLG